MIVGLLSNPNLLQKAIKYVARSLPICVIIVSGVMEGVVALALGFYMGAAYACLLLICILVCASFWCLPERNRLLFYKYLLVLNVAYVSLAFFIHGAPQGRYVGGIHPNIISQASIILAFSGLMILSGWKKTLVILASLYLSVLVDSRYALVTVFIMWFGHLVLDPTMKSMLLSLLVVIAFTIIFTFTDFFTEVFSLNDPDRGFSSGIGGRASDWDYFLPQLSECPFFGYGFRNLIGYVGAHNGFMQYILENGLVISFLFFSALFFILISNLSTVWRSLSERTFQAHEGRVVLVTLLAIFFAAMLQPQLISFGDEFGPLTLVILLYVPKAYRSLGWRRRGDVAPAV
jgi:O-Antigen ligase